MDLEAASSSGMSMKKAPKGAFHGSASGSFSQKKKVALGNIKHFGNEKDISLVKLGSSGTYSDMDSESSCGEDNIHIESVRSLLSLATNTLKAKKVNTSVIFRFPLGFPNYNMDEKMVLLPPPLSISLEKSIEVAILLAKEKGINVNSNLKKQRMKSNWAVVIKEISMNTLKKIIITAVSKFGNIKSIKVQLIGMWQKAVVEFTELEQTKQLASRWSFLISKDLVHMAMAIGDWDTWMSKDHFRALLFTLPMGTTICCAVVGFKSEDGLKSAFCTEPIFGGVRLSWARIDLVCCGKFGKVVCEEKCFYSPSCCLWWQVLVLLTYPPGGFHSDFGLGSSSSDALGVGNSIFSVSVNNSSLGAQLATVKHSLELLTDQVFDMMQKLNNMVFTAQASSLLPYELDTSMDNGLDLSSGMVLDRPRIMLPSFPFVVSDVLFLGPSSSKILTTKMSSLESKLMALEASIGSVLAKLDLLCVGLGFLVSSSPQ
ncbi:hypothetical protein G9A89_020084 [Geosiphon pyriformis]|nr:hypothetical protein G9A89_020084 [Geosiphon pyriformis]